MRFYQFKCAVEPDERLRPCEDKNEKRSRNEVLGDAVNAYNDKAPEGECCFLSRVGENELTGGLLTAGREAPEKIARAFLAALGFQPKEPAVEEITLRSFRSLVRAAYREDLIESDDLLLNDFGLDLLTENGFPRLNYRETMFSPAASKAAVVREAEKLVCGDTLTPELQRIYAGKKTACALGHPVHYTVETDSETLAEKLGETLLSALLSHGRLQSAKAATVFPFDRKEISEEKYDLLYRCCEGGAVLVKLEAPETGDDDLADSREEIMETVCAAAKKYRHKTLTVFCLPRACERLKKLLCEELGEISLVSLREDLLRADRARAYLRQLAKENGVQADESLTDRAETDRQYLPDELRKLFDEWFNEKLKTAVYPQYGAFATCRNEAAKAAPEGSAFEELQEMIGLIEAKNVIGKALDYYKLQRIYKDRGVPQDRPAMHMVFTGNPGTAKTTAARLFARIMKENGLLSRGHLVEVGRSDLVARYVGWTAKTVQEKFKVAKGGVLFIDEAYSLVDDRGGSFGDEAINTIVQEMENRREDLVVIFAGYPDEMERFLDKNPGLRSRIAFHVPFADYAADELCEIAKLIGKQKGVTFSDGAVEKLHTVFEAARLQPDFGNGRYARNAVEQAKMNMASRLLTTDLAAVTKETLTTIEATDIDLPTVKKVVCTNGIGFTA